MSSISELYKKLQRKFNQKNERERNRLFIIQASMVVREAFGDPSLLEEIVDRAPHEEGFSLLHAEKNSFALIAQRMSGDLAIHDYGGHARTFHVVQGKVGVDSYTLEKTPQGLYRAKKSTSVMLERGGGFTHSPYGASEAHGMTVQEPPAVCLHVHTKMPPYIATYQPLSVGESLRERKVEKIKF